jgi:hypothetical protein
LLPDVIPWRIHTIDPKPSVEFLRSGPTLSYDIFVFRFYEAAVRDLRQSAMTRRWIFCSIPAIHFRRCSEAAIGLRVINFSA